MIMYYFLRDHPILHVWIFVSGEEGRRASLFSTSYSENRDTEIPQEEVT